MGQSENRKKEEREGNRKEENREMGGVKILKEKCKLKISYCIIKYKYHIACQFQC